MGTLLAKGPLLAKGKTLRHSTSQSRQTFSQIHYVIIGDLASNRDSTMHLYALVLI